MVKLVIWLTHFSLIAAVLEFLHFSLLLPNDSRVNGCSSITSLPALNKFLALLLSTAKAFIRFSHSSSSFEISSNELPNPVMINLKMFCCIDNNITALTLLLCLFNTLEDYFVFFMFWQDIRKPTKTLDWYLLLHVKFWRNEQLEYA